MEAGMTQDGHFIIDWNVRNGEGGMACLAVTAIMEQKQYSQEDIAKFHEMIQEIIRVADRKTH